MAVYISLIVSASLSSQTFVTSAATALFLPADGEEWMHTKEKEEAVIDDRGDEEQSVAGRPHPGPPGPGT